MTRRGLGTAAVGLAAAGGIAASGAATPGTDDVLAVPAQRIPVPTTISVEAQAAMRQDLARIAADGAGPPRQPDITSYLGPLRALAARFRGTDETIALGAGALLYRATPEGRTGRRARVAYVDIHGGGFVSGGGEMNLLRAKNHAAQWGIEVYSVDYRLAPDHPYPAALDDCMATWRRLLKTYAPADLVIGGSSAGGNLAAAMLLRGRDEGLPMPAGLILHTPVMDLTGAGDSRRTNFHLDTALPGGTAIVYGKGETLDHPYLSPVNGDFGKGWPPTLLTTGTRDLLLSDTVRTHRAIRRAGGWADLLVTEAGSHGGFQGRAPEDRELLAESLKFMLARWGVAA